MLSNIVTYSGAVLDLRAPDPAKIELVDIAWALSHLNRFNGHTRRAYSVAQHAVLVADLCPVHDRWAGLMHDAPEAFLGDVASPLKRLLPEYRKLEAIWWLAIARRFELPLELPRTVKDADAWALHCEARALMPESIRPELGEPPRGFYVAVEPFDHPRMAYSAFLMAADRCRPRYHAVYKAALG